MLGYIPDDINTQYGGNLDAFIDDFVIPKVSDVLKKVFGGGPVNPPSDNIVAQLEAILRNGLKLVDNNTRITRK